MPVVLPDNTLAPQLPQPRIMIATSGDQIRTIRTERAIPDPPLVSMQCRLEWKGRRVTLRCRRKSVARLDVVRRGEVNGPDAGSVVGGAGCEVSHVRRQQDAGDVGVMGKELADRYYRCDVAAHDHFPDVDVALSKFVSIQPPFLYSSTL